MDVLSLGSDEFTFKGQVDGILVGLFHGFTIVFNLIASLFVDVRVYTFPNSGRFYDLGYTLGAAAFFSVSSSRTASR